MKPLKKLIAIATCLFTLTLSQTTLASASTYTVAKDDSLFKIGSLFQVPIGTLMNDNYLNSDIIYPGQSLIVSSKIHQIVPGNTLYQIAKDYKVSLSALRQANHKWDNLLLVGDQLLIPGVNNDYELAKETKTTTVPSSNSTTKKTVISYTSDEVDLLARLITAEAGGESYEAMKAVGGVVVNRVQSGEWPSTINDVIYHVAGGYYQFTPVLNGHINKAPSETAKKAAWEALYGADPSNGAIYFYDDSTTNQWLLSKTVTARIGALTYAR